VLVEQAGEVCVHTLVTRDKFVAKSESRHQSALFDPENCTEAAGKEDSLDCCKSNQALSEAVRAFNPFDGPLGFLFHGGNVRDCFEKEVFLIRVLDKGVYEDRVGLAVNVLHHHLEAVEASGFGSLDFGAEALGKVFQNNTVRGSEESEYVLDEMLFIRGKPLPVFHVLAEVDLVNGPETSHLVLIHLPNVFVLDRKDDEAIGVFFKQGLWHVSLRVDRILAENILWRDNLRVCSTVLGVVLVKELRAKVLGFCVLGLGEFSRDVIKCGTLAAEQFS